MSRTFAYCRVSTIEQTTENQILAIQTRGYEVRADRVVEETISGGVPAMQRPKFANMVNNKLEEGDTLVVLKLDRLGRDNIDVQLTITMLREKGIKIVCMDLPIADLSSSEGMLMLQMFSAFSEFERNRLKERTLDGLNRAKANGKILGRPKASGTTEKVQGCKTEGLSQQKTVVKLNISLATVKRHWNKEIDGK